MQLNDDDLKRAILEGDYEALEKLSEEFEEESDDDQVDENDEGKTKQSDTVDDASDGGNDAGAQEGAYGEGNGQDADTDTDKNTNADDKPTGETSTQTDQQADKVEVKFDEQGNAIIPKEQLSVLTKDGKHFIPYEVLESARAKAGEYNKTIAEERAAREKAESALAKNNRQAELLKQQLSDAGIDPEQLPEDIEITPELLESLDDYGEVGKVIKALAVKQSAVAAAKDNLDGATQAKDAQSDVAQDPRAGEFKEYCQANPEFARIMEEDGDEFETLDVIYKQVGKSAEFKDQPLAKQLDEALRRTGMVFGKQYGKDAATDERSGTDTPAMDEAKAAEIAKQKVEAAKAASTPASPSEVGASEQAKVKPIDRAKQASGQDLLSVMGELSPEEIEALLEEI